MKRALITGVNGFVGPWLADELQNNGYEVVGSGREAPPSVDRRLIGIPYHVLDVTSQVDVERVMADIQPTHIFHLAGIASPRLAEQNRDLTFRVHVDGTKHLLSAAQSLSTKPKILIVSSAHVYGAPQYLPINEAHPLSGKGVYAESRIEQEKVAAAFSGKLSIVVVRSFNHTGPGQGTDYVLPRIIKTVVDIQQGHADHITMGDPMIRREFLHVADVVRAYRLLLEQNQMGLVTNVCRGASVTLKEIIEYSRLLAGLETVAIQPDPLFLAKKEISDVVGDPAKLHSLIDWRPVFTYEALVEDMYRSFEKRFTI